MMVQQQGKSSLRGSDVTATRCTCNSTARLVILWGWSRFPVCGLSLVVGDVGRSVAQSVEVTPKRSKERGGRSQRLQGQSPKNESETRETEAQKVQSTWPAESGWTSEGFWQFEHKVQSNWPVSPSDTGQVKSSGKVGQPT